jgi:hypothetical protein
VALLAWQHDGTMTSRRTTVVEQQEPFTRQVLQAGAQHESQAGAHTVAHTGAQHGSHTGAQHGAV